MARQLAQSSPRRKAQNSVEVASAWLAPLLVLAIADEARTGRRPIPQQLQVLIRRMAVGNRLWGQKRMVGVQAVRQNRGQIHAYRTPRSRPFFALANISEASCVEHLGLRLLLRADPPVRHASRFLRNPAHQPGSPPRCCHSPPDRRMASATNSRKLCLGSKTVSIYDSRSRQPLWPRASIAD